MGDRHGEDREVSHLQVEKGQSFVAYLPRIQFYECEEMIFEERIYLYTIFVYDVTYL